MVRGPRSGPWGPSTSAYSPTSLLGTSAYWKSAMLLNLQRQQTQAVAHHTPLHRAGPRRHARQPSIQSSGGTSDGGFHIPPVAGRHSSHNLSVHSRLLQAGCAIAADAALCEPKQQGIALLLFPIKGMRQLIPATCTVIVTLYFQQARSHPWTTVISCNTLATRSRRLKCTNTPSMLTPGDS